MAKDPAWKRVLGGDSAWKRVVGGLCGIGIMLVVAVLARQRGASGEDMQRYEGLFVGVAGMSCGIIALRRPGVLPWPTNPRRKRVFALFALVFGAMIAMQSVLGK